MARGTLRVYLGAAPGVGKTFRMLGEGQRRAARGGDVVIGLVETHGRAQTAAAAAGLEVVSRKAVRYRGSAFEEMDVEAIVARHPELVLVDELAHTNIPGSANGKRWQDVVALLNAGINVITTVNVQHLESLNDVVEQITGVPQRETVPDSVVRAADQIELVDMTAEALRRRLAHGNVYAPDKVDAALANYFRVGNLTALRELALLWLADSVEDGLRRYREEHGIAAPWETRERVVVALTGGPEGEQLVRRAARVAARGGADLLAVHVARSDGLRGTHSTDLAGQQALVESLGGRFQVLTGDDASAAVLQFARAENATQLVVGASRRPWWARVLGGLGTASAIVDGSGSIDVHLVTHPYVDRGRLRGAGRALSQGRRLLGWLLGVGLLPAVTAALTQLRGSLTLASMDLVYVVVVVAVALAGGVLPAVVAAIAASLLLNWWFTPPLYSFTISDGNNALSLVVFVAVALVVAGVVDLAAARREQAATSSAQAEVLASLATTALVADHPVDELLAQLSAALGGVQVALEEAAADGSPLGGSGEAVEPLADGSALTARGRPLTAAETRLVRAVGGQLSSLRRAAKLQAEAAGAHAAEAAEQLRSALLSALGHDLRTPLSAIKAGAATLRDTDVDLSAAERSELLAAIEDSADRLSGVTDNLMDLSRVAAGAVSPACCPVPVASVLALVADTLEPAQRSRVHVEQAPRVGSVLADQRLTVRALLELVGNALRHAGPGPVQVTVSRLGDRVELRVVDHGPGLPATNAAQLFQPFQRLGDSRHGLGLGLAAARGLVKAQGGSLEPEDTPGGGLTMVLTLPAAD